MKSFPYYQIPSLTSVFKSSYRNRFTNIQCNKWSTCHSVQTTKAIKQNL